MDEAPEETGLPPQLQLLRRLVTGLMVVMIVGFLVLIGALVIRLTADPLPLPDRIALPDGTTATAFTQGPTWYAVVTGDDRILIFDRGTGALRQTIMIETE